MDDTATLQQLIRESHATNESLTKLNLQMALVLKLLNGDINEDITGIRPRLAALEKQMNVFPADIPTQITTLQTKIESLEEKWTAMENRYLGAKWIIGLLGLATSVLGVGFIRLLFGIH